MCINVRYVQSFIQRRTDSHLEIAVEMMCVDFGPISAHLHPPQ